MSAEQQNSWLVFDAGVYRDNLAVLQQVIGAAALAPVVKSNAYGHGLMAVAEVLCQIPHLAAACVFDLGEASQLREAGFAGTILVLGPMHDEADAAALEVVVTLHDEDGVRRWAAAGRRPRAFVKLDVGLSRLGLGGGRDGATSVLGEVATSQRHDLLGVFTHLPGVSSDVGERGCEVTRQMWRDFRTRVAALPRSGWGSPGGDCLVHAGSSWPLLAAGDVIVQDSWVRIGLMGYGLLPSGVDTPLSRKLSGLLRPCLGWRSRVVQVREMAAGQKVGYGGTYVARGGERIGVVPVGYFDGLRRGMVAHRDAGVLLAGQFCRFVGRGCMNMVMIDVSAVEPHLWDEDVVLVGESAGRCQSWDDLARWGETLTYEVMTGLATHLPRQVVSARGARRQAVEGVG